MMIFLSFITLLPLFFSAPQVANCSDAELYFLQGKWGKAIKEYKAVVEETPTVETLIRLADAYFYSGDLKAAEETYDKALLLKENPDSIISLAMIRAIKDKYEIKKLINMADTYGDNSRLWRATGIAHMKHGDDEKALYYLYKAVEKDPEDYMSYFFLGMIYEAHFLFDDAIVEYKKSVQINPNYAQALNNLGYCYKEKHYYSYAIEMYKKAIAVDPENAGFYYNIGNAYTHKQLVKEAYESYKRALELEPTFAKAHYNMGRTYIKMDKLEEALEELKLYLKYWTPSVSPLDAPPPKAVKLQIEELEEIIRQQEADEE
jgi:tetratricopeptide (TPR) repeat protein